MNFINLIAILFLGIMVYLAIARICDCIERFFENRISKFEVNQEKQGRHEK